MNVTHVEMHSEPVHGIGNRTPERIVWRYEVDLVLTGANEIGEIEELVSQKPFTKKDSPLMDQIVDVIGLHYPGHPKGAFASFESFGSRFPATGKGVYTTEVGLQYVDDDPGGTRSSARDPKGSGGEDGDAEPIGECWHCGKDVLPGDDWIGGKELYCSVSCLNTEANDG